MLMVTSRPSRGEIQASQVLVATGSWSGQLTKHLHTSLPIQPGKGYTFTIPKPDKAPKIPMILAEEKVSITPLADQLRFGGTLELAGFDPTICMPRTHNIVKVAQGYALKSMLKDSKLSNSGTATGPVHRTDCPFLAF